MGNVFILSVGKADNFLLIYSSYSLLLLLLFNAFSFSVFFWATSFLHSLDKEVQRNILPVLCWLKLTCFYKLLRSCWQQLEEVGLGWKFQEGHTIHRPSGQSKSEDIHEKYMAWQLEVIDLLGSINLKEICTFPIVDLGWSS